MPLNFSSAHSSRIAKHSTRKPTSLTRSLSTPFSSFSQRKPAIKRSISKPESIEHNDNNEDELSDCLDNAGRVHFLSLEPSLCSIALKIEHIRTHMFDALPEAGGFNSVRIAEILNFRKALPSTASVAHVHALSPSPTSTEREIAELIRSGLIRRIIIPGRGIGGSSIGDGLVMMRDVESAVREAKGLEDHLAEKFLAYLRANPAKQSITATAFSPSEITKLMRSGFTTSSFQTTNTCSVSNSSNLCSSGSIASVSSIAKAASGSIAAVGGADAVYDAGGRGGLGRSSSHLEQQSFSSDQLLNLSLPNTGPHLSLLLSSRMHLLSLLRSSRHRELPLYLLRERWEGGIAGEDAAAKAKKYRGEFAGVIPARTRKWRQLWGVNFEWVLGECVGAGLVEVFETGSVGKGVRIA